MFRAYPDLPYRSQVHPVSVTRFPSFRSQTLENLSRYLWKKRFLSNPAPGENLLSGNLVMETGCSIERDMLRGRSAVRDLHRPTRADLKNLKLRQIHNFFQTSPLETAIGTRGSAGHFDKDSQRYVQDFLLQWFSKYLDRILRFVCSHFRENEIRMVFGRGRKMTVHAMRTHI